ncbi:hypothetical protein K1719_009131 [Acacia pycnantha]|nr:hypothetical protein K1719_009131 [Acacia pycnantha]
MESTRLDGDVLSKICIIILTMNSEGQKLSLLECLFRSIDGRAAFGFPETPEDAAKAELISRKDNIIDRSILDAYINAIRRAKDLISGNIGLAEEDNGIDEDTCNYWTFFFLSNRELKKPGEYEPSERTDPDFDYLRAQEAWRFMIYVHTKIMIVKIKRV